MQHVPVPFAQRLLVVILPLLALMSVARSEYPEFILTQPTTSAEVTIWNEPDAQEHRQLRYEELKSDLKHSPLGAEHQDLLASALSWFYFGIPISTYHQRVEQSSRWDEPIQEEVSFSILETGVVDEITSTVDTNDAAEVRKPPQSVESASTPFSHWSLAGWDRKSGTLQSETDSDITFRFSLVIPELEDPEEVPSFVTDMLEDLHVAVEFSVNKHTRKLQSVRQFLIKPLKRLFLFTIKEVEATVLYEFIETCGCMAVSSIEGQLKGSVIFLGRVFAQEFTEFSEIQCESPLRYLSTRRQGTDLWSTLFD